MAQPRAQPAEVLVELDSWVRGGGRLLVLADPALQWPSERPLGDALRPPFAFADTGLLGHWGLTLDAPDKLEERAVTAGGRAVRTAAPGRLRTTGEDCSVDTSGFVASCTIGRGRAIIVADSDFLDLKRYGDSNLQLVFAELAALEQ